MTACSNNHISVSLINCRSRGASLPEGRNSSICRPSASSGSCVTSLEHRDRKYSKEPPARAAVMRMPEPFQTRLKSDASASAAAGVKDSMPSAASARCLAPPHSARASRRKPTPHRPRAPIGAQGRGGHRGHGRRLRRNHAKPVGAPVGRLAPVLGARHQLLQQRTAPCVEPRGCDKPKILARHERSGGILSILSACDSPRIQLQASMSSAPMETASCESTMRRLSWRGHLKCVDGHREPNIQNLDELIAIDPSQGPGTRAGTGAARHRRAPDLSRCLVRRSVSTRRHWI